MCPQGPPFLGNFHHTDSRAMQEFTGDPEDRKAFKAWRKKRGDAAARIDKRRQTWDRARKAQVKERARAEDERIQVWPVENFLGIEGCSGSSRGVLHASHSRNRRDR